MIKKIVREWTVEAPWGKMAVISWGNPENPPVLLVHGFMDSAATFYILLDRLPDKYYYVSFDMPGHGKSDPLPPGIYTNQLHLVEPLRVIVEHLEWKRFAYIAHSMGCLVGLFFNNIHPGYIQKMIFIDPLVPLADYYNVFYRQPYFFNRKYREYYDNYQQWNSSKPRLHTYEKAISLAVRNRGVTEEQAEILLSRGMVPMGIDTFKLSWETRMKKISEPTISEETLYTIMTQIPPTLCIDASEFNVEPQRKDFADNLLQKCFETLSIFHRVTVIGGHDIHLSSPKVLAQHVVNFLEADDYQKVFRKSKL